MSSIRSIVLGGLFVAVGIVLTRFFAVMVPIAGVLALRISFGTVPPVMAGLILGPVVGGIVGALIDLIGATVFPLGPYFPGFTFSWFLLGFLPAALLPVLKKRRRMRSEEQIGFLDLLAAVAVTEFLVSVILDTLWLHFLYNKAIVVLLPPRVVARCFMIPVDTAILYNLRAKFYLVTRLHAPSQRSVSA